VGAGTWIGIGTGVIDTFVVKVGDTYHSFSKERSSNTQLHPAWAVPGRSTETSYWPGLKEAPAVIDPRQRNLASLL